MLSYGAIPLGWSRDGRFLVCYNKGRIISVNKDGTNQELIASLASEGSSSLDDIDLYMSSLAAK